MVLAEPLPFRLGIGQVIRVILGHLLPVVAEVALNAILSLQLKIGLLYLLKKRRIIPGGPIVNGDDVSRRPHRLELLGILVLTDIL